MEMFNFPIELAPKLIDVFLAATEYSVFIEQRF